MRAFFTGDRAWQDTYIVDVLLGGLREVHGAYPPSSLSVIHDRMPVVKAMAEARHSLPTSTFSRPGKRGDPAVLFALASFTDAGLSVAGERVDKAVRSEVPVYAVFPINKEVWNEL